MPADLYDVLGTSDDASAEELKGAYRERVREYHPDVNDHPEGDAQFKLIRKAHDVLSDPAERKDYDRLGHREYVEKNLDDLPPISVFPDEDLPDGTTTSDADQTTSSSSSSGSSASTGPSDRSRSTTTDTSGSASGSSSRTSASTSTTSSTTSTDTDSRESTTTDSGSRGSDTSASASGSTNTTRQRRERDERGTSQRDSTTSSGGNGGGTTAGAERDSWDAATNTARSPSTEPSTSAGARRRRGLRRWYGVVAIGLLAYLAGLGIYAAGRQAALRTAVSDLTANPVGTLLGGFPLASPGRYALNAVETATAGTPTLGLLLPVGAAVLPLVVLTAVGRFGRGAAWVYALPSLAPAVVLGLWFVSAVPTWAALLGLVVLPVLSGGGFLVDVGRYLRATR
ncbi:hypothetical protein JCM30237_05490 [Halolamina litorea]|uniref:DnaJ domain-containing protein n=1 Tax=Halolamina litorea TaxID=1515593 RepID=A0ABD6BPP1_9EURY|nr:DnaJ domain-containing protein [Halolamina litorea]